MNKIEDDGGNLTSRIESLPYTLLSLFIYLSPFDSFMLLYRNLLHVITILEIRSLHPGTSTLNGTVQNACCGWSRETGI